MVVVPAAETPAVGAWWLGHELAHQPVTLGHIIVHRHHQRPPLEVGGMLIDQPSRVYLCRPDGSLGSHVWALDTAAAESIATAAEAALGPARRSSLAHAWRLRNSLGTAPPLAERRAAAALEMYAWSIHAAALGCPVGELLGVPARFSPVYASDVYDSDEDDVLVAKVRRFMEQGYAGMKIRCGQRDPDILRRRAALTRSLIASRPLMVDAVWAWDEQFTLEAAGALADLDLAWIEDPLPLGDLGVWQRLCRHSPIPLATGEAATSTVTLLDLAAAGIRHLHLDVQELGGLAALLDAVRACAPHAERLLFHVFPEASAHVAGAGPPAWLEYAPLWGQHLARPLLDGMISPGPVVFDDPR